MAEKKTTPTEDKVDKTCSTTIALTVATRDLLQTVGFPSERYDDTIRRLSAHYENCPFAQLQVAAVQVLQSIAASDGALWAYPKREENPEEYAKRVIAKLDQGDSLVLKGKAKLPEEKDKDYLLRLILMGVKGE
jgi:hypothetical protein